MSPSIRLSEQDLEFDPEVHEYRYEGEVVPSVTQVITHSLGLPFVREYWRWDRAARLGTAVHRAIELFERGTLDWNTVDNHVRPYLRAWQRFREDTGIAPLLIEQRVADPFYRYAGTMDFLGEIRGQWFLIDWKTSKAKQERWGPQTAAYLRCLEKLTDLPARVRRASVRLRPDGIYQYDLHDNPTDLNRFLEFLKTYKEDNKHGTESATN